ncbi:MAG: trypsin-like serine peptidase [Anaerolineae bacterium]
MTTGTTGAELTAHQGGLWDLRPGLGAGAFPWPRPEVQELHRLLAIVYCRSTEAIALVQRVDEALPAYIPWDGSMLDAWHGILEAVYNRGSFRTLMDAVLADKTKAAFHPRLEELLGPRPVVAAAGGTATRLDWQEEAPLAEGELERLLGDRSTLLGIAFLEEGLRVSRAVGRITATFPSGRYHGTGFLIGPDLLLTNHHVLYDQDHGDARATVVDLLLDYEESFSGKLREGHGFVGLPASIVGDKADDWAVIRLAEAPDAAYPRLPLAGGPVTVDDPVFIVQHPGGRPKEIGLTRNLVRHVGADRVQYLTDTEGGSSGSPVFNARWQVVALHHQWTTVGAPGAGAGREYRNQGVAIGRVVAGLRAAGVVV